MGEELHHDDALQQYTEQQRADLENALAFNRELAAAGEAGRDLTAVTRHLDPDPARFIWVEEGGGHLHEMLDEGRGLLAEAPSLPGHERYPTRRIGGRGAAARPTVAGDADGRLVLAWLSWEAGVGEQVVAALLDRHGQPVADSQPISGPPADCFRPTALFDTVGHPWIFYARSEPEQPGSVHVYARRMEDGGWSPEERVSTTDHPSFNQEVVAHPDGSVECVWQGRHGNRFGVHGRRWQAGQWGEPYRLDSEGAGNTWDPSITPLPNGESAYAWCAYEAGSYGILGRYGDRGALGPARTLTTGSDYALHPSLATAGDGTVWCAFDLLTVHGHGGSGPTALVPTERLGNPPPLGMREPGEYVPPEMVPYADGGIRAVRITEQGVEEDPTPLAQGVEVNPCGMPQAAAAPGGGITVSYRILRRLPLLLYYWEVAVQQIGADGPGPVSTLADSDGGNEEPAVGAAAGDRAVVACVTDRRKERALEWHEGFGGERSAQLAAHVGEVLWHGLHGLGEVAVADLPDVETPRRGTPQPAVRANQREEARAWVVGPQERYSTDVDGVTRSLYWGDLHRHSLISRCTAADDPGLEDFYRYAWDVCDYDFWAVTDHAENSTAHQWWTIQKIADLFHVPEQFVPLYGFEWTSELGHQNVIYGDVERDAPIFSATAEDTDNPDKLWEALRRFPDYPAITIPHHPGAGMVPYDWNYGDPEYMRLVEVFQSCRGNYEDDGCFRQYSDGTLPGTFTADGLRQGHRFGLIASSDHGFGASYVGAFADGLTREDVFAAFQARRTLAATARGIVVDFRIGDTFMGGERRQDGPVTLDAFARGYRDLARLDVVRNGELVHAVTPELELPEGWVAVPLRVEWGRSGTPRDWSGRLTVEGGEVLETPFWSRDVCEASRKHLAWRSMTHSFGGGGMYGPTRGGVDLTALGPPDARVDVETAAGSVSAPLQALQGQVVEASGSGQPSEGLLRLQPGAGGLTSLGSDSHSLIWADTDPPEGSAWYYVRVFLVDGEMAWSSPIWVDASST